MGLTAVALFGAIIFLPLFFQLVLGAAASKAGLMLSPAHGRSHRRLGRGRAAGLADRAVQVPPGHRPERGCAAFLLLAWLSRSQGTVLPLELALVGLGLGLGLVMPNLTTAIQNAVPPEDLGVATSAASFFRSLGGALGVALSGAWMTARLHRLLPPQEAASLGGGAVDRSIAAISALPEAQRTLVVHAYRQAIGSTFLLGAAVAAPGAPDRARAPRAAAPQRGPAPRREAGRGRAGLRAARAVSRSTVRRPWPGRPSSRCRACDGNGSVQEGPAGAVARARAVVVGRVEARQPGAALVVRGAGLTGAGAAAGLARAGGRAGRD